MEEAASIDNLLLNEIENKISKCDKMDEIVKFTILIKLQAFKTKLEKEDLSILEQSIGYLRHVSTSFYINLTGLSDTIFRNI